MHSRHMMPIPDMPAADGLVRPCANASGVIPVTDGNETMMELARCVRAGDNDRVKEILGIGSVTLGQIELQKESYFWGMEQNIAFGAELLMSAASIANEDSALEMLLILLEDSKQLDYKEIPIESENSQKRTCIYAAAKRNHLKLLDALIHHGFKLNKSDITGKTPIFEAAATGANKAIELLLKSHADINHIDDAGETCLFTAYRFNQQESAELLIKNGANPQIRNKRGMLAIEQTIKASENAVISITSSSESQLKKSMPAENLSYQHETAIENGLNVTVTEKAIIKSDQFVNELEVGAKIETEQSDKSEEDPIHGNKMSYFQDGQDENVRISQIIKKVAKKSNIPKPKKAPKKKKKLKNKYTLVFTDVNGTALPVKTSLALAFKAQFPQVFNILDQPDQNLPYPLPTSTDIFYDSRAESIQPQKIKIDGQLIDLPSEMSHPRLWQKTAENLISALRKPIKELRKKKLTKKSSSITPISKQTKSPALLFFSRMFTSANFNIGVHAGLSLESEDKWHDFRPKMTIRHGVYPNAVKLAYLDKMLSRDERESRMEKGLGIGQDVHKDIFEDDIAAKNKSRRAARAAQEESKKKKLGINILLHVPDLLTVFKGPSSLSTIQAKLKANCYASFGDLYEEVLGVFEGWLTYCGIWNEVGTLAYQSTIYWNKLVLGEISKLGPKVSTRSAPYTRKAKNIGMSLSKSGYPTAQVQGKSPKLRSKGAIQEEVFMANDDSFVQEVNDGLYDYKPPNSASNPPKVENQIFPSSFSNLRLRPIQSSSNDANHQLLSHNQESLMKLSKVQNSPEKPLPPAITITQPSTSSRTVNQTTISSYYHSVGRQTAGTIPIDSDDSDEFRAAHDLEDD